MTVQLFAGIAVRDHPGALAWYERLFGSPSTYVVSETEALWEVEPADRETYGNGVRKVIYRDPEGNELGIGGGPA